MADRIPESDIEAYLKDEVRKRGWGCNKNINDPIRGGTPGIPDQTVRLPGAHCAWVECKAPDKLQAYMKRRARFFETGDVTGCSKTDIRQYREQQHLLDEEQEVHVVGSYKDVDELMYYLDLLYGG